MQAIASGGSRDDTLAGFAQLLLDRAIEALSQAAEGESFEAAVERCAIEAGLRPGSHALEVVLRWSRLRLEAQWRVDIAVRCSMNDGDVFSLRDDPLGPCWPHLSQVLFERAHRRVRVSRAQVLAYDFVGAQDEQPWVVRLCHELDAAPEGTTVAQESAGFDAADALALLDPRIQPARVEWHTTRARRASALEASRLANQSVSQWLNTLVDAQLGDVTPKARPANPGVTPRNGNPADQGG